jgi:hypothetical protein
MSWGMLVSIAPLAQLCTEEVCCSMCYEGLLASVCSVLLTCSVWNP